MKAFFVTGTDTGVGKTHVSVALLEEGHRRGLRTAAMKPAETGCQQGERGELVAEDAGRLAAAATLPIEATLVCPFRYAEPAAPVVAARGSGRPPTLSEIRRCFDEIVSRGPELMLVEGAGGLLVGLNEDQSMADLAAALALPVIVVARDGLGTLNHTLLTVEAARSRGLEVAAVVLNGCQPGTDAHRVASNIEELCKAGVPVTEALPHGSSDVATTLSSLLAAGSVPRGTLRR